MLSCVDSRGPVELIFDQSIDHVFVGRAAGNVGAPDIIGSLEYRAWARGIPLVMVLGHDSCGGIKTATAAQGKWKVAAAYRALARGRVTLLG